MITLPMPVEGIEPWHALDWVRGDEFYTLTLGLPNYETRASGLLTAKGDAITKEHLTGWSNVNTVIFATDAEQYSFDEDGERLPEEKILARHTEAVSKAWAAQMVE